MSTSKPKVETTKKKYDVVVVNKDRPEGFSGSLFVSFSALGSFYGGSNFPTFDSLNGISSANIISSRVIDPLVHIKDPIPCSSFRSHFSPGLRDATGLSRAVRVDLRVFLNRGSPHSLDPDVGCVPGIILPKSWVPDPDFRSLQTPEMGVLAQGEMPNS